MSEIRLVNMANNLHLHLLQIVIHFYRVFHNIFITGYALTNAAFNYYCEKIRRRNIEALRWIDNIPPEEVGMGV